MLIEYCGDRVDALEDIRDEMFGPSSPASSPNLDDLELDYPESDDSSHHSDKSA